MLNKEIAVIANINAHFCKRICHYALRIPLGYFKVGLQQEQVFGNYTFKKVF